jgi:hypothetical protein
MILYKLQIEQINQQKITVCTGNSRNQLTNNEVAN